MAILDYLRFENPEIVVVAIGLLVFIVTFTVLQKRSMDKGASAIVALVLGASTSWYLVKKGIIYNSEILSSVLIILSIAVLLVILRAFVRAIKR